MLKKRIDFIDVAKFLGVILVIFAHSLPGETIAVKYIFTFHMPLFFFINGMTMRFKKDENFGAFLWKRIKSYIFPMIFLGVIIAISTIILSNLRGAPVDKEYFLRTFIETIGEKRMFAIWFLAALFCTDILFYFCHWLARGNLAFTGLFSLLILGFGIYCNKHYKVAYIYNFDASLIAIIFVYFGYLFMHPLFTKVRKAIMFKRWTALLFGLAFLALGLYLGKLNRDINHSNLEMFAASYDKFYLTLPSALFGSLGFVLICYTISNPLFAKLGSTTIVLFSLHQDLTFPIFREYIAKGFYESIIHANPLLPPDCPEWYSFAALQTVFTLAVLLVLYYLIIYSPLAICIGHKEPKWFVNVWEKFVGFIFKTFNKVLLNNKDIIEDNDEFRIFVNKKQTSFMVTNNNNNLILWIHKKEKKDKIIYSNWVYIDRNINVDESYKKILLESNKQIIYKPNYKIEEISTLDSLGFSKIEILDKTSNKNIINYTR